MFFSGWRLDSGVKKEVKGSSEKSWQSVFNIRFLTTVLAKGTSAGWVPSEGEGIRKHAKQFLKQAGGVPLQERSPAA